MLHKYLYAIFLLVLISTTSYSSHLKKVTLQLSWYNQFQFAGYYIAKEKGFYRNLGLDVIILPYKKKEDIVSLVSKEKIDFSIGHEYLLFDNNENIVALYALFQASPLVLISLKESNINSISDFKNKKISTRFNYSKYLSIKAMNKSHGIDKNFTNIIGKIDVQKLLNKDFDIISSWSSEIPYKLDKLGIKYNVFDPKDYGFEAYNSYLYTSSNLIKKDKILVKNFRKASLEGWKYAYSNIDESIELIKKKYDSQELTRDELKYEANLLKKLSYYKTNTLGEIKKEKITNLHNLYNVMGLLKNKKNLDNFIFNEYKLKFTKKELSYIKNSPTVKMCVIPNSMPYSAIKDLKFTGFSKDYIDLIKKRIDLNFILVQSSSKEMSKRLLLNKQCDIISTKLLNKNAKKLFLMTSPYLKVSFVVITKSNVPFVDNLHSLHNVNIGIDSSYVLYNELKLKYPNINFIKVKDIKEGSKMVLNNKLYGYLDASAIVWYYLQNNVNKKLKISAQFAEKNDFSIAVNKNNPTLYAILNKAVHSIDENIREKILSKWMTIEYEKTIDYKLLAQIFSAFTLICLFILNILLIVNKKNKNLQKELKQKTKELSNVNVLLKKRIKEEVEKNLKKNKILTQQSKLASMGEMIANIAHQWRQPLNNINLLIHYVRDNYDNKEFTKKDFSSSVHDISLQLNYMSKVIDDFRMFFKPKNKAETFDLNNVFKKTLNLISTQFTKDNIKIIDDVENIEMCALENELMQVLINLINNSKDALKINNIKNKLIFVSAKKQHNKIIIKIKDNAGGIKEEHINRVFEPYFTTKDESSGTGIGLYMSEEIIIKHMQGTIYVKNKDYKYQNTAYTGAVFTIILPLDLKSNETV